MQKTSVLYKTLVVGVIFLFLGIGIQPAFAEMKNAVMKTSAINSDDTKYLANLSMDFGEYIYNNTIDYEELDRRPYGNWTVNVNIKFRCPENLKIIIRYEYLAGVLDFDIIYYDFFNVKETVTIINGSNPPDINKNKTFFIANRLRELLVTLKIKANLTAYEYIDGKWIMSHHDEIFNETWDYIIFNYIRASERTKKPNDDCNLCPKASKQQIIRLRSVTNRLEMLKNVLSSLSKHNPKEAEKYKELSNKITSILEISKEFSPEIKNNYNPIICNILEIILAIYVAIMLPLDTIFLYLYYEQGLLFMSMTIAVLGFICFIILFPFVILWFRYCSEIPYAG